MNAVGRLVVDVSFAVMVVGTSLAIIMIIYHMVRFYKKKKK